jgi:hypothetical protein
MKKTMLIAAVIAVAGMQTHTARAGDRGWATAGRISAGVAIGAASFYAVDAHAGYSVTYSSAPTYCPPAAPVVYAPPRAVCAPVAVMCAPPVVVYRRPVVVYSPPVVCAPPVRVIYHSHHGRGHHGRW